MQKKAMKRDLLLVADVVQQDDRDRQQRRRRHRPPVLDVRHRQLARPRRRGRSGSRARRRRRRRSRSRARSATRLGTTCVVNCEKSHMSRNSTRIVDSRGKIGRCPRCTVHTCQAARIASGTAISAPIASAVVEPRGSRCAPPAATDASAGRAARAPTMTKWIARPRKPGGERERVQLLVRPYDCGEVHRLAEARDAHEELRGEREDQGDRRRDAQPGGDVRHGARERDPVEALERARPRRSARCRSPPGRRRGRRRSSGRAAARTRRTRRGRPRSSASCRA